LLVHSCSHAFQWASASFLAETKQPSLGGELEKNTEIYSAETFLGRASYICPSEEKQFWAEVDGNGSAKQRMVGNYRRDDRPPAMGEFVSRIDPSFNHFSFSRR